MGHVISKNQEAVIEGLAIEIKEPPRYRVLLLNDDYTTMTFVIRVLETVFHKSTTEATRIMLQVHEQGVGLCGVYTREIAETKVFTVQNMAERAGYPLKCITEPQ